MVIGIFVILVLFMICFFGFVGIKYLWWKILKELVDLEVGVKWGKGKF